MDNRRKTTEEFIKQVIEIHGYKYDYSKVNYVNNQTKVCIICPEHGEFLIRPDHLLNGSGCKRCFKIKQSINKLLTIEEFIERARKVHGDKYDYSKVEYKGFREKIKIICPEHGEFWQTANDHLKGCGCKMCGKEKMLRLLTTEEFIERAKKTHGDKYDYSKVEYINAKKPIKIICSKHGEFEQTPSNHLLKCGCQKCASSKMVNDLIIFFKENSIKYVLEKKFEWLKHENNSLRIDIFLPEYNVGIECQGLQHFKSIEYFGGEERFSKQNERDEIKKKLCEKNKIRLIYYSNLNIEFPYKIINNKTDLLNEIKNE